MKLLIVTLTQSFNLSFTQNYSHIELPSTCFHKQGYLLCCSHIAKIHTHTRIYKVYLYSHKFTKRLIVLTTTQRFMKSTPVHTKNNEVHSYSQKDWQNPILLTEILTKSIHAHTKTNMVHQCSHRDLQIAQCTPSHTRFHTNTQHLFVYRVCPTNT